MNSKYIWGIIGLMVIGAAIWWIMGTQTTLQVPEKETVGMPVIPQVPEKASTQEMVVAPIVTYTNDGFFPAELTVKAGTMVTFINQSDSPMWVASGPHPTHTLYPEFDEKSSVLKGGSYSFTFEKTGTHPYHNHVLLGKYGKITVE